MPEKTCSNCGHWIKGACHVGPPQVRGDGGAQAIWPVTAHDDYCAKHSLRTRPKGKRSKAPDGAILRLALDEIEASGVMTRAQLIWEIKANFELSRTAAVSRVNVMSGQGLISIKGEAVKVERPELADPKEDASLASAAKHDTQREIEG